MRILFITPYPTEGASNRLRIEQFLPFLKKEGMDYRISPFMSKKFYSIIYHKGRIARKILFFILASFRRLFDIFRAFFYDVIFVHREAYPLGPPLIEWIFSKTHNGFVYDFDDAIFLPNSSIESGLFRFLKYPKKIEAIIRLARIVIAGNSYLLEYTKKINSSVALIPTCIDTETFKPSAEGKQGPNITIGWIGSSTTQHYLKRLYPILEGLSRDHSFRVRIIGAGRSILIPGVDVENLDWSLKTELESLKRITIGVYPLDKNEWSEGKSGFKAIQFMSLGIPVVASPVGANKMIIKEGFNGFFAASEGEWKEKLSLLMKDQSIRQKIGTAGRETVEQRYSVKSYVPKFLEVLKNNTGENNS